MEYKKYTTELKEKIISTYISGGKSIRKLATEYDLNPSTVSSWIQRSKAIEKDDGSHSLVEISEIISNAHDVPKETVEGTIIFRMNSFEFEIGLGPVRHHHAAHDCPLHLFSRLNPIRKAAEKELFFLRSFFIGLIACPYFPGAAGRQLHQGW